MQRGKEHACITLCLLVPVCVLCAKPSGSAQGVEGDEEKPESWEHEEERADDDVEMGDDAASEPEPPPVKS